jgi:hypothetical protein
MTGKVCYFAKKPNTHIAQEISVNTPGKTLVGKLVLSLVLLNKILGSCPGIMVHQRNYNATIA